MVSKVDSAVSRETASTLLPITLDTVSLCIGEKRLLDNITLHIAPQRRTFVLGANGAGKSTLLRVLHGLAQSTSGSVRSASGLDLAARGTRRFDAMLFQRPIMLRRSVLDNVLFGLDHGGTRHADHNAANALVLNALTRVGLAALIHRPARVLSGGEQQRLALARALVRAPEVLYLDEPTASIDPQSTRQIEALIQQLSGEGVSVVMTTHNLAQAKRLADDIVLLHEGRLAEATPATDFFREPRSAEGRAFLQGETL